MHSEEVKKIVKKIFVYHSIAETPELNSVWLQDFSKYSADSIERAWNEWRGVPENDRRKPKSMELIRLIKARSHRLPEYDEKNSRKLKHGRSEVEDELIRRLKAMNKNNPNLMAEVKACESAKEKMLILFAALNEDFETNSVAKMLLKKYNSNTSETVVA